MHQPMVSGGGAGLSPARFRRSFMSVGPGAAPNVVIFSTAPWHVWHFTLARRCALCGKYVNSGSLLTRTHGIGSPFARYSASFLISGRSAAVILWQPRQRLTDGSPAYSERRASLWQYWQSILYVSTWTLWGKLIGWRDAFATAGWRLHDDTAMKTRMARSTTPSAPTPALAPIDSRSPSGGLSDACAAYHSPREPVNRLKITRGTRAPRRRPARRARGRPPSARATRTPPRTARGRGTRRGPASRGRTWRSARCRRASRRRSR